MSKTTTIDGTTNLFKGSEYMTFYILVYFSSVCFLLYFHFHFSIFDNRISLPLERRHQSTSCFPLPTVNAEGLTLETLDDFAFCDRQYGNLFIFRCVSEHCLRSTLCLFQSHSMRSNRIRTNIGIKRKTTR